MRSSLTSRQGGKGVRVDARAVGGRRKSFIGQLKKSRAVVVNSSLLYAEREIWSPQYALWRRYMVSKPRLPTQEDLNERWVEMPVNSPRNFATFIGTHNQDLFVNINNVIDIFDQTRGIQDLIVLSGGSGTGKSSATRIFLDRLCEVQRLSATQFSKFYLLLDAKKFVDELSVLWNRIEKFSEPPLEKFIGAKFRVVAIDNYDAIPPSAQQNFKRILATVGPKLKYILVCSEPKTAIISFILGKSTVFRTRSISERDALTVILSICHRNRIGFELEGIKAVFDLFSESYSCSLILDTIQQVFLANHFISASNVAKHSGRPVELPIFTPTTVLEPLDRCSICTLRPPCQHISEAQLISMSIARRKDLPRYKDGSMTCPEFARYGRCSMFTNNGHCSLDHPKNLHRIAKPTKRCDQCTIPWPCNHCAYSKHRDKLMQLVTELHQRIGRLRQVNVPEPPLAFTRYLDNFANWRADITIIDRKYIIQENLAALKATEAWIENEYSTNIKVYQQKNKTLRDVFGELLTTQLLNLQKMSGKPPKRESSLDGDNSSIESGSIMQRETIKSG